MNSLKIAWRSIQHRGLGSFLTILSMALGVMLVVAVLTVHGVVSRSFKSNSNFPYELIMATSGSGMQVTMNTVFYLSSPVENIPYEYYLAVCDKQRRGEQLRHSIAWQSRLAREQTELLTERLLTAATPGSGLAAFAGQTLRSAEHRLDDLRMGINVDGEMKYLVEMAIPVNLGDYLDRFRVVGTVPEFFTEIFLDLDTREQMTFAEGRGFEEFSREHGFFEAVLGATVARELNLKVGDVINPIHGDPNDPSAHTHEQGFTIVGVLDRTGLPYDRAVYANMEGFFLMEDHAADTESRTALDPVRAPVSPTTNGDSTEDNDANLKATRLPIEQREVTAVLIRASVEEEDEEEEDDGFVGVGTGFLFKSAVDNGFLNDVLTWSDFRPLRSKDQIQAVAPVEEVTILFETFVNPIRWILLALTIMICIVSGISILVGIYSSMAQRRHEIAVMRALGANRSRVLTITLLESITLAMLGGIIGWVLGHALNAAASPIVESRTGVSIGFFDFAPGVPILGYLGFSGIPFLGGDDLEWVRISPELFLIPGLILLAVIVGVYPAITAYRTDVAESLGT
ncbi:MAG: ABC transporter permease [Pirellulaceae bacterium]